MPDERISKAWAACAVLGAAVLWSSSYAVTKNVLDDVGPLTIGAVRFTLAAILLAAMTFLIRGPMTRPTRRQRRLMYLSGLLGITVYFILENVGVQLSVASDASLIVATYPLMTMLLELVVFRARMPLTRVAGVLLAGGGAVLIVRNGAEVGGGARWLGDILLLIGGLVWAGYSLLTKMYGDGLNAVVTTYHQTLAGAGGFLIASILEIRDWAVPSPSSAVLLGYLAVACSIGGFLLYNHGLRGMKSSAAVNILNLVPVFGVIGAIVMNDETVRLPQIGGGAIIIAGVTLGLLESKPPSPENIPLQPESDLGAPSSAGLGTD
ncbi:DMT family transporter [Sphaerimonospora sp. CA-214678]|uniref:DMT family transporter n=1 Tax=Sphaerimonospora sp. CA-214678 TaxID=3240029 RepID=UPI003D8E896F